MSVPVADLHDLLSYDPSTGALTWKARPIRFFPTGRPSPEANMARWNKRHAGNQVQGPDRKGYVRFSLFGEMQRAHRVIWAMQTGEWPAFEIDHRDGDRSNNRWLNLRAAPDGINAANRGAYHDSTSPYVGVSWITAHGKWRAQIGHDGSNHHIGYFDSEEEAAAAYARKAVEIRGEWARGAA